MLYLGILIGIGSAIAFAALGLLALVGGVNATQQQIVRGFKPDNPGGLERALTVIGVWVPIVVVAIFGVLSAIHIIQVMLAAL
jgi:hypothetical protein